LSNLTHQLSTIFCDELNSKSAKILSTKNSFLAQPYFLTSIVRLSLSKIRLTKSVLEGFV